MFVKSCATVLLSLLLCACATEVALPPNAPSAEAAKNIGAANSLVRQASERLASKQPTQALLLVDQAIPAYERAYRRDDVLAYSARTGPETLVYALEGQKRNTSARVFGPEWGLAYFLKGFALIDLHRVSEAKAAYEAAIKLSPRNSQFLSERAHVHGIEGDWTKSFEAFEEALKAAELSPPALSNREKRRALRGMAFAQIELGNLDAAKALHEQVLRLDPSDPISREELAHIQDLKRRSPPSPAPR